MVSGDKAGHIKLWKWDCKTNGPVVAGTLSGHDQAVRGICVCYGNRLVTAGEVR